MYTETYVMYLITPLIYLIASYFSNELLYIFLAVLGGGGGYDSREKPTVHAAYT